MFKTFLLFGGHHPDDFEAPVGHRDPMPQQKICINLKRIDIVSQSGNYQDIPVEPRPGEQIPDEMRGINPDAEPAFRPARPARPARAQRRRQVFVMDADRFVIQLDNGHSYTVMGVFDEFCEMLSNFREKMESV